MPQNEHNLTDTQKDLICKYFLSYCLSKRSFDFANKECDVFEKEFGELIPDFNLRMGLDKHPNLINIKELLALNKSMQTPTA